mgnify:CR=1 FL=1
MTKSIQTSTKVVAAKATSSKTHSKHAIKKNSSSEAVEEKIIRVVAELRKTLNKDDIPKLLVAILSGYSHMQSTGFSKAMTKLNKDQILERSKEEKGCIRFTEKGLSRVLQAASDNFPVVDVTVKNNGQVHELLLEMVKKRPKVPSGDKVECVWNCLADGQPHTKQELLKASGYGHISSTGFVKILEALKDLGFTESAESKKLQLKDFVFPFGRSC